MSPKRSEEQQARLQAASDMIKAKLEAMKDSIEPEDWLDVLRLGTKLHHYSARNLLLLGQQQERAGMPPGEYVASFKNWQKVGRNVVKGEKALRVMAPTLARIPYDKETKRRIEPGQDVPKDQIEWVKEVVGFRMVPVFSASQTEGEPLPKSPWANRTHLLEGRGNASLWQAATAFIQSHGFKVEVVDELKRYKTANGVTFYSQNLIQIRADLSEKQQLQTLLHECGHALMHSDAVGAAKMQKIQEVEAESFAFMVANYYGIDSRDYSIGYIGGWSGGKIEVVESTLETVRKNASNMIDATEEYLGAQSEDSQEAEVSSTREATQAASETTREQPPVDTPVATAASSEPNSTDTKTASATTVASQTGGQASGYETTDRQADYRAALDEARQIRDDNKFWLDTKAVTAKYGEPTRYGASAMSWHIGGDDYVYYTSYKGQVHLSWTTPMMGSTGRNGPIEVAYRADGSLREASWQLDRKIHRDDGGPTYVAYSHANTPLYAIWQQGYDKHRAEGPAVITWNTNGQIQREDWYLNGKHHREDGPAISKYDSYSGKLEWQEWWRAGTPVESPDSEAPGRPASEPEVPEYHPSGADTTPPGWVEWAYKEGRLVTDTQEADLVVNLPLDHEHWAKPGLQPDGEAPIDWEDIRERSINAAYRELGERAGWDERRASATVTADLGQGHTLQVTSTVTPGQVESTSYEWKQDGQYHRDSGPVSLIVHTGAPTYATWVDPAGGFIELTYNSEGRLKRAMYCDSHHEIQRDIAFNPSNQNLDTVYYHEPTKVVDGHRLYSERYWNAGGRAELVWLLPPDHPSGADRRQITLYPNGAMEAERWLKGPTCLHCEAGPAVTTWYETGELRSREWIIDGLDPITDGPTWIRYNLDGSVASSSKKLAGRNVTLAAKYPIYLMGTDSEFINPTRGLATKAGGWRNMGQYQWTDIAANLGDFNPDVSNQPVGVWVDFTKPDQVHQAVEALSQNYDVTLMAYVTPHVVALKDTISDHLAAGDTYSAARIEDLVAREEAFVTQLDEYTGLASANKMLASVDIDGNISEVVSCSSRQWPARAAQMIVGQQEGQTATQWATWWLNLTSQETPLPDRDGLIGAVRQHIQKNGDAVSPIILNAINTPTRPGAMSQQVGSNLAGLGQDQQADNIIVTNPAGRQEAQTTQRQLANRGVQASLFDIDDPQMKPIVEANPALRDNTVSLITNGRLAATNNQDTLSAGQDLLARPASQLQTRYVVVAAVDTASQYQLLDHMSKIFKHDQTAYTILDPASPNARQLTEPTRTTGCELVVFDGNKVAATGSDLASLNTWLHPKENPPNKLRITTFNTVPTAMERQQITNPTANPMELE